MTERVKKGKNETGDRERKIETGERVRDKSSD